MTFRPLYNQIFVRPDPMPSEYRGIALPERRGQYDKEHSYEQGDHAITGTVLAVGTGHVSKRGKLTPLDVQPGEKILFARLAGELHVIDGERVQILPEEHVYGVVTGE